MLLYYFIYVATSVIRNIVKNRKADRAEKLIEGTELYANKRLSKKAIQYDTERNMRHLWARSTVILFKCNQCRTRNA